jgi:hypothetical protein
MNFGTVSTSTIESSILDRDLESLWHARLSITLEFDTFFSLIYNGKKVENVQLAVPFQ